MNCESVKKFLPFYYYNDLDKTTTLEIKSHIKNCPDCRKELNCFKKTIKLVDKEEKIKLPFVYRRALLNKILEASNLKEAKGIFRTRRVFAFGSGVAAAVFLFFFLFLSIRTTDINLKWQDDSFTYKTEQLEESIADIHKIIAGETIQSAEGHSIDVEINSIYEDIEEITVFLSI